MGLCDVLRRNEVKGMIQAVYAGSDMTDGDDETVPELACNPLLLPLVDLWLLSLAVYSLKDVDAASAHKLAIAALNILPMNSALPPFLDPIVSKLLRYYSLTASSVGENIRYQLMHLHHQLTVVSSCDGAATCVNLLLQLLTDAKEVEAASALLANTTFPTNASNNALVRNLYYTGVIKALQLSYSEAHTSLQSCLRKAPSCGDKTACFRGQCTVMSVVVQLLMGDIPSRDTFNDKDTHELCKPYLQLTQAVRSGVIDTFHQVVDKYKEVFKSDNTLSLIQRLQHTVVKAGLRRLSLSYSRISLDVISQRLGIPQSSAGYVVAKAILDGVIDGKIDHAAKCLVCNERDDIYTTSVPTTTLHRRIAFTLNVYNDAVMGMRYPDKDDWEKEQDEKRKKKTKDDRTEEEVAEEIEREIMEEDED
jgi:26S proteasome regulatory subunit N3